MHEAVKGGQKALIREIETLQEVDPSNTTYGVALASFRHNWSNRLAVMEAMVEYTETLAAVADAPRQRAENVQAIGEAVQKIAANFGPYGGAVTGALDIASKLDGLVAQALAARTLRQAVERADPIVANVSEVLAKDFAAIGGALDIARAGLPSVLKAPHADALEARRMLLEEMPALYRKLAEDAGNGNWKGAAASFNAEVADAAKALAEMDRWYLPLSKELRDADMRLASEIALCEGAESGFRQWAAIHGTLLNDLRERRQPNWRLLLATVREIQQDIERIQQHESD
jgi:hypothetical protein